MFNGRAGRVLAALLGVLAFASGAEAADPALGEKYALLVGVREYDKNELRNLPYSEPDVVELARVLQEAGYRRVIVMTQTTGAEKARLLPLSANIRKELTGLLRDRAEADSVLVAFAGHGVQFKNGDENYFCPMDVRLADKKTLIPLSEVYRELEQCGAGFKLLMVDACRNDPRSDNARARPEVDLESVTRPQLKLPPGGVAAFFSCSAGEKAFEHSDLKHGVFFHFVIEGLRGKADLDHDNKIDLDELVRFAKKRVPDFVQEEYGADVRQMPELVGKIRGTVPLLDYAARKVPLATTPFPANEGGMWLFNQPPRKLLRDTYGFDPSDQWLEHVRKASLRFNSGGSGAFVSADGLIVTNHHVTADSLQRIGDKEHDYTRDGFYARTRGEEKKCQDMELNVLMSIEDVSARVEAAVDASMTAAQAAAARRRIMAEIEKDSLANTGFRSDVVALYQGGQYHLYRYKKYTDLRLVFAPEQQIAFFGGDPDNFEYPRYCLDFCFLRAYEDGAPARVEHYLKWSPTGAGANEFVLVSGHPGRTSRHSTVAELEYLRDHGFPLLVERLLRWEKLASRYSARGKDETRHAQDFLFSIQNSLKARHGGLAALADPALLAVQRSRENTLRSAVAKNPNLKETLTAWERIAQAEKVRAENLLQYDLLEKATGFHSILFSSARSLVRAVEEQNKPNGERLREYRDSNLETLKAELFADEPIVDAFEKLKLADSLSWLAEKLGPDHALVQKVLAGKSAQERAAELVGNSRLQDAQFRKKLYEGGEEAVSAARDPMIALARLIDPAARSARRIIETQEDSKRQAHAQIARAKFLAERTNTYPDATFTLRLAFGVVKGYEEKGKAISFQTTFSGLYRRSAEHDRRPPYDLPPRWVERKELLNLQTPLNFACTADIVGGNSGSPVINKNGEVVGLIFDGNIQSLGHDFVYTDAQARAVSVHSRGILEALRKIYGAEGLVRELTGGK